MKWGCHIDYTTKNALEVLGLIKHVLYGAPERVRLLAYVTLCRPLLEYACEIWDPTTQFLITKLEDVQSKAIRYIKNLKGRSVSVTDSRVLLGLDTLQAIRKNKRIILFHTVLSMNLSFLAG